MGHGWDLKTRGYATLDPHIRELVRELNNAGLETFASCEGHADREMPHPWVAFANVECTFPELIKIMEWVAEWNVRQQEAGESKWAFSPMTRVGIFFWHLIPNRNNSERNPEVLRKLRRGAESLAEFLRSKNKATTTSTQLKGDTDV